MRPMSELKSQHTDFQVHSGQRGSTLMPEPLVTSDTSVCLAQMGLVAPFKFNIKEEKKKEEQLSSAKKKWLSYSCKD